MDLTVIICTWNRSKSLAGVLTSLEGCIAAAAGVHWEVLIVDNNSTDDTKAVCEAFARKTPGLFRYLSEPQQGKTFALNAGIQQAQGEIIALTDDDLTVSPRWIAEIYKAFHTFECAAVGGKIVPVWNCKKPSFIDFDGEYAHPAYGAIVHFDKGEAPCQLTATVVGANMAVRKSVFEKYGPYRADLNRLKDLLGGEDTEYCRRLMHAGEKLFYIPAAVVYHPVEEHRTTRKYLQSMAFHYGRWLVRMDGVVDGAKCYFGVPRYFFGAAAGFFARWMLSLPAKRRFFYKLELARTLGQMVESKRWLRSHHARQPVPGLHLIQ